MCLGGMRCAALAYQPCERGSLPTIKEPRNLVLFAIIGIEVTFPALILKLKFVSMRIGT